MSSDPSHGVQPATIGLPQTQTINSSAPSASGRLQIMDGYVMRDVWVPSDGDGEAHDGLGNNFKAAQPNWKIYTGDAPAPDANRHSEMPPKFCYLDDKAVWNVFSCKLFSKANKGLYWPFDFIHNGNLRLSRKNRGRPALDENQQEREVDSGKAAKISYRLSGSPFAVDAEFLRIERDKETRAKVAAMLTSGSTLNNPVNTAQPVSYGLAASPSNSSSLATNKTAIPSTATNLNKSSVRKVHKAASESPQHVPLDAENSEPPEAESPSRRLERLLLSAQKAPAPSLGKRRLSHLSPSDDDNEAQPDSSTGMEPDSAVAQAIAKAALAAGGVKTTKRASKARKIANSTNTEDMNTTPAVNVAATILNSTSDANTQPTIPDLTAALKKQVDEAHSFLQTKRARPMETLFTAVHSDYHQQTAQSVTLAALAVTVHGIAKTLAVQFMPNDQALHDTLDALKTAADEANHAKRAELERIGLWKETWNQVSQQLRIKEREEARAKVAAAKKQIAASLKTTKGVNDNNEGRETESSMAVCANEVAAAISTNEASAAKEANTAEEITARTRSNEVDDTGSISFTDGTNAGNEASSVNGPNFPYDTITMNSTSNFMTANSTDCIDPALSIVDQNHHSSVNDMAIVKEESVNNVDSPNDKDVEHASNSQV